MNYVAAQVIDEVFELLRNAATTTPTAPVSALAEHQFYHKMKLNKVYINKVSCTKRPKDRVICANTHVDYGPRRGPPRKRCGTCQARLASCSQNREPSDEEVNILNSRDPTNSTPLSISVFRPNGHGEQQI